MVYRKPFDEMQPNLYIDEATALFYACQSPNGIHGYDLAQVLGRDVTTGSVYRMLRTMRTNGLFDLRIDNSPGPGKARRVHTITEKGHTVLERYFRQIIES